MRIYTIEHRTDECVGVWARQRSSLGSGLGTVTCDKCGMQYADTSAAVQALLAENWFGLWIQKLADEGVDLINHNFPRRWRND
jgi:hypothetical protein